MKNCKGCGQDKDEDSFHRDAGTKDGLRPRCKVCVKTYDDTLKDSRNQRARESYLKDPGTKIAKTRAYHVAHPEWAARAQRAAHLKKRYDLTIEEWENFYTLQQGRCAICFTPLAEENKICTDHDHVTGQVRGLLCHHCNIGLGSFKDSEQLLLSAIQYLRQTNTLDTPVSQEAVAGSAADMEGGGY